MLSPFPVPVHTGQLFQGQAMPPVIRACVNCGKHQQHLGHEPGCFIQLPLNRSAAVTLSQSPERSRGRCDNVRFITCSHNLLESPPDSGGISSGSPWTPYLGCSWAVLFHGPSETVGERGARLHHIPFLPNRRGQWSWWAGLGRVQGFQMTRPGTVLLLCLGVA